MDTLHRTAPFARPIKFLQFGEGNFLRAFIDWQIDLLNERTGLDAGVVVVRPTDRSTLPLLDAQGGLFTTLIRGLDDDGQPVREFRQVECVQRELDLNRHFDDYLAEARRPGLRFVVSNTTEAGIAVNDTDRYEDRPAASFPAKLTRWLHERWRHFGGTPESGVVLLPCELIDDNGPALKAAVQHFGRLWALEPGFSVWLDQACTFCSTLVDRIVTGYPADEIAALQDELGYSDQFLVTAEHFYLFVIQGPGWLADELKLAGAGLNIKLVDDIRPYKQRKVGVLNGGHTVMVPVALLAGVDSVGAAMTDAQISAFLVDTLEQEIMPSLPLPREELAPFAAAVLRRFRNPYIHHRLESIALNSWAKFAARVLPQLLTYQARQGALPARLVLALAATVRLYRGDRIALSDDAAHLEWFAAAWADVDADRLTRQELARRVLAREALWGRDLNEIPGFTAALGAALASIDEAGMRGALHRLDTPQTAAEPA
ncbi:tagaturonate reductase [Roseateles sp.]|uniref:tagaturonate reductase n=1 Tax=Roseateles sp. TaxID=1971397 RepID=UPI0025D5DE55|nr:tagaturonate reductase [Roseateles sp.]MBV8034287.1 tagaturonate reductase [Roseateles sp.]